MYWQNNVPFIASRGSFGSDQAIKGTHILHTKYIHLFNLLKKDCTYLFEIIYPENRIVVDYKNDEDLILLAVINNKTGKDASIEDTGFKTAKRHVGISDFKVLQRKNIDNAEGYVVKFENDYRIKIKFEDYIRLHRIITNVSTIIIWEMLSTEAAIDQIIEHVQD